MNTAGIRHNIIKTFVITPVPLDVSRWSMIHNSLHVHGPYFTTYKKMVHGPWSAFHHIPVDYQRFMFYYMPIKRFFTNSWSKVRTSLHTSPWTIGDSIQQFDPTQNRGCCARTANSISY